MSKVTQLRGGPDYAREWSTSTEPGPKGQPYRLIVSVDPPTETLIEVSDAQVTSDGPDWKALVGKYPRLNLTTDEAEWLSETLKSAVEHVRARMGVKSG